jgi:hypothetical protein
VGGGGGPAGPYHQQRPGLTQLPHRTHLHHHNRPSGHTHLLQSAPVAAAGSVVASVDVAAAAAAGFGAGAGGSAVGFVGNVVAAAAAAAEGRHLLPQSHPLPPHPTCSSSSCEGA